MPVCDVCQPAASARPTLFGYKSQPRPRTLCREVLRWVQSLDLSYPLKHPRRDCANGFFVAEILSRYYPQDCSMHSFANGASTAARRNNWDMVQRACGRNGFRLPKDLVAAVQQEQPDAANELLEVLYEHLTGRQIRKPEEIPVELLTGAQPEAAETETAERSKVYAGVEGGAAISQEARLPADLKFGSIKQRTLDDAVALRRKLAAAA